MGAPVIYPVGEDHASDGYEPLLVVSKPSFSYSEAVWDYLSQSSSEWIIEAIRLHQGIRGLGQLSFQYWLLRRSDHGEGLLACTDPNRHGQVVRTISITRVNSNDRLVDFFVVDGQLILSQEL